MTMQPTSVVPMPTPRPTNTQEATAEPVQQTSEEVQNIPVANPNGIVPEVKETEAPAVEQPVSEQEVTTPVVSDNPKVDLTIPKPEPVRVSTEGRSDGFTQMVDTLHNDGFDTASLEAEINGGGLSNESRGLLTDKYGSVVVTAMEQIIENEKTTAVTKHQSALNSVHEAVGGADEWRSVHEWAKGNSSGISAADRAVFNKMLTSGGVQAKLAAQELQHRFKNSPAFKQVPQLQQGTSVPAVRGIEPISRTQYTEELRKAHSNGDKVMMDKLNARANHTMQNHPDQWRIRSPHRTVTRKIN